MKFQEVKSGSWLGINGEADVLPLNYSRNIFIYSKLQHI